MCGINENKHPFQDFFLFSLITHLLYTYAFPLIFFMWDYVVMFLCASDVAKCGACDRANKSRSVDLHLSEGVRHGI